MEPAARRQDLRRALTLYLITDPILCKNLGVPETVARAVKGGVTMVQLRDKGASTRTRVELARALLKTLEGSGVGLVINDDIEAAVAANADGAHIGQGDMAPQKARALLGEERILGLSCEDVHTVAAARHAPIDYLGIGPVFATATKTDHKPAIGWSGLSAFVSQTDLPVVAIGGIKPCHMSNVMAAGADGAAVVSAICGQDDPKVAASEFLTK